jgi:hypothetical protein
MVVKPLLYATCHAFGLAMSSLSYFAELAVGSPMQEVVVNSRQLTDGRLPLTATTTMLVERQTVVGVALGVVRVG